MQTPLVTELLFPRAAGHDISVTLQVPTLRLPAAAWSTLLSALALDPDDAALPGTATVVERAPGNVYHVEYSGRVAGFSWPQRLGIGTVVHLARMPEEGVSGTARASVHAVADSTQVSETVEALSRLLDRAFRAPPQPFTLAFEAADISAAPQRLAATLANAVSGSGVFFEAHLAEWVRGRRSIASIRSEAESRQTGDAALHQQLSLLVTNELAFQFPAWPGQTASLAVEPAFDGSRNDAAPERDFIARFEAELHRLGAVHATLSLTAYGIDLLLRADSPQTAAAMRNGLASLTEAFVAAGLRVGRIEVSNARHA